jgi:4-amino-4-deoxy-L-arabinose transferase-like glycosyltransferase
MSASQTSAAHLGTPFSKIRRRLTGQQIAVLILFCAILVIAGLLRFYSINLAEFKGDEAATSFIVRAFVQNGAVPLVGPPLTTGGNAGPIYYFILAVPFLFSTNPVVASSYVALLNMIGFLVTFKFAREFFNTRVALVATALAAVSPFAFLFSRKIWNPDVIFPFTAILLYCLYSFALKKKPKYLVPLLASYAVVLQIHPITFFLAPVLLIFLARFYRLISVKYLLLGIALSLLLFSPFIYGELTSNFHEAGSFVSTFSDFHFNTFNLAAIQLIYSVTSGSGFDYVLGSSASSFYASILNLNNYFVLESLLLYLGYVLVTALASRHPFGEGLKYSILFVWVTIPMLTLLFFYPTDGLWPHYFVMFYPATFLILAVLFDFLASSKLASLLRARRAKNETALALKIGAVVLLLFIISIQAIFDFGFLSFVASYGGTAGDYGVGVQYKIDVARYIAQNSNGSSFTISSDFLPGNIGLEYYYLLSMYGKVPASSASTNYVIVDELATPANSTLLALLAPYPEASFGPLAVYTVRN